MRPSVAGGLNRRRARPAQPRHQWSWPPPTHVMTTSGAPPQALTQRDQGLWCGGRDLNPHALTGHQALNLARLPFPPPPQGASGQCIEASLGRPLPDQPHGDRQVETSPCPVPRQHLRRAASSGEGEAAAVTEREQPPPGKGAQRPGELSVVACQRLNDDTSGGDELVDPAHVDTYVNELADDFSEVGSPQRGPEQSTRHEIGARFIMDQGKDRRGVKNGHSAAAAARRSLKSSSTKERSAGMPSPSRRSSVTASSARSTVSLPPAR